MRSNWKLNSLLMEIMIAVLFFALCSGVILNTMVASRNQSLTAGEVTAMLDSAQSVADCLYAADDREAALLQMGFTPGEEGFVRDEASGRIVVTLQEERTESGLMQLADIKAETSTGETMALRGTRFVPEEVQ